MLLLDLKMRNSVVTFKPAVEGGKKASRCRGSGGKKDLKTGLQNHGHRFCCLRRIRRYSESDKAVILLHITGHNQTVKGLGYPLRGKTLIFPGKLGAQEFDQRLPFITQMAGGVFPEGIDYGMSCRESPSGRRFPPAPCGQPGKKNSKPFFPGKGDEFFQLFRIHRKAVSPVMDDPQIDEAFQAEHESGIVTAPGKEFDETAAYTLLELAALLAWGGVILQK